MSLADFSPSLHLDAYAGLGHLFTCSILPFSYVLMWWEEGERGRGEAGAEASEIL